MNPNLLLDAQQLQRLTDQRRRDLAGQWGRPRVPSNLGRHRAGGARRLARWLARWPAPGGTRAAVGASPTVPEGC